MSKHTPGPWAVERDAEGRLHVVEGDFLDVAEVGYLSGPDPEANARLIAAAPELLEALEQLFRIGEFYSSAIEHDNYGEHGRKMDLAEWATLAQAAIAKAKGEQV